MAEFLYCYLYLIINRVYLLSPKDLINVESFDAFFIHYSKTRNLAIFYTQKFYLRS